jgi:hypothetical protein
VDTTPSARIQRAPTFRQYPEAALWELIPLVCACDHLQEAYDRSYSLHPASGRDFHTEVDI